MTPTRLALNWMKVSWLLTYVEVTSLTQPALLCFSDYQVLRMQLLLRRHKGGRHTVRISWFLTYVELTSLTQPALLCFSDTQV